MNIFILHYFNLTKDATFKKPVESVSNWGSVCAEI